MIFIVICQYAIFVCVIYVCMCLWGMCVVHVCGCMGMWFMCVHVCEGHMCVVCVCGACVCAHMHAHAHSTCGGGMHTIISICGEQMSTSGVSLYQGSPYISRQGLSLNLELTDFLGSKLQISPCL